MQPGAPAPTSRACLSTALSQAPSAARGADCTSGAEPRSSTRALTRGRIADAHPKTSSADIARTSADAPTCLLNRPCQKHDAITDAAELGPTASRDVAFRRNAGERPSARPISPAAINVSTRPSSRRVARKVSIGQTSGVRRASRQRPRSRRRAESRMADRTSAPSPCRRRTRAPHRSHRSASALRPRRSARTARLIDQRVCFAHRVTTQRPIVSFRFHVGAHIDHQMCTETDLRDRRIHRRAPSQSAYWTRRARGADGRVEPPGAAHGVAPESSRSLCPRRTASAMNCSRAARHRVDANSAHTDRAAHRHRVRREQMRDALTSRRPRSARSGRRASNHAPTPRDQCPRSPGAPWARPRCARAGAFRDPIHAHAPDSRSPDRSTRPRGHARSDRHSRRSTPVVRARSTPEMARLPGACAAWALESSIECAAVLRFTAGESTANHVVIIEGMLCRGWHMRTHRARLARR